MAKPSSTTRAFPPRSPVPASARAAGFQTSAAPFVPTNLDMGEDPLRAGFTDASRRRELIAKCAYYRAERRAFEPGLEADDWCNAEREIDEKIFRGEIAT